MAGCTKKPTLLRGLDEGPDDPSSHRIRTLVAGNEHVCALYNNGSVACWGKGAELALGTPLHSGVAKRIVGVDHARRLGVGRCNACALDAEGALTCWGFAGHYCQEKVAPLLATPTRMVDVPPLRSLQTSSFDDTLCGIAEDGTNHCVMSECASSVFTRRQPSLFEPCKNAKVATYAGETSGFWNTRDQLETTEIALVDASCARRRDGRVHCESHVTRGLDPIPELDAPTERVTRMSGVFHSICFVLGSGTVECRSSDGISIPKLPGPARTAAATLGRGCATGRDGTLACWTGGGLPFAPHGGTTLEPLDYVDPSAHARLVVTDVDGFCSLDEADVVRCWTDPHAMKRITLP